LLGTSTTLVLAAASLVAGTVDAVAGGGGLITLPALLLAGLPPDLALGTNKGQSTFGSGSSFLAFLKAGTIDRRRLAVAFGCGGAGALFGARAVEAVPGDVLRPLVLVLLLAVAVVLFFRRDLGAARPPTVRRHASLPLAAVIALVLGFYDGFFGPGTGTFLIMAFVLWLGDTMSEASANAKVVNFASNLVSLALFSATGRVIWAVALPMAAGQVIGGLLGARLVLRRGDRLVRGTLLVVVAALVVKLGRDFFSM
jgi:uncharacterized protein